MCCFSLKTKNNFSKLIIHVCYNVTRQQMNVYTCVICPPTHIGDQKQVRETAICAYQKQILHYKRFGHLSVDPFSFYRPTYCTEKRLN